MTCGSILGCTTCGQCPTCSNRTPLRSYSNGIVQVNLGALPPSSAESKHLRAVMSGGKHNRGLVKAFPLSNAYKERNQSVRTDWLQRSRLSRATPVELAPRGHLLWFFH